MILSNVIQDSRLSFGQCWKIMFVQCTSKRQHTLPNVTPTLYSQTTTYLAQYSLTLYTQTPTYLAQCYTDVVYLYANIPTIIKLSSNILSTLCSWHQQTNHWLTLDECKRVVCDTIKTIYKNRQCTCTHLSLMNTSMKPKTILQRKTGTLSLSLLIVVSKVLVPVCALNFTYNTRHQTKMYSSQISKLPCDLSSWLETYQWLAATVIR